MRNFIQISILLFLILSLNESCSEQQKKAAVSEATISKLTPDSLSNILNHSSGSSDSLDMFLKRISLENLILKRKIYLVRGHKKNAEYQNFQYNDKDCIITITENYDDNIPKFNELFLNGKSIKNYVTEPGMSKEDNSDISFGNNLNEDSITAIKYDTPIGKFLLLNGTSVNAQGQYANIVYGFLIPLNDNKSKGFIFSSLNVPNDFYFGYLEKEKKFIYLDISTAFPEDDKSEYNYEIKAKNINLDTYTTDQLQDANGKDYYIKLAIPNVNDFSKYRVIESHWW